MFLLSLHLFITLPFHALSQDLRAKYNPAFVSIYLFSWLSADMTAVSCAVCVSRSMNWSPVAICDRKHSREREEDGNEGKKTEVCVLAENIWLCKKQFCIICSVFR